MTPERREQDNTGLPFPGTSASGSGPEWVRKRDGRLEPFNPDKLTRSLLRAMATEGPAPSLAEAQGFSRAVRLHVAASGMASVASDRLAEVCREVLTRMGRITAARHYWAGTEQKRRRDRLVGTGRGTRDDGARGIAVPRGAEEWESWWIEEAGLDPETARRLAERLARDLAVPGNEHPGWSEGFIREWTASLLSRWGLSDQAARLRSIGLPVERVAALIRGEGVAKETLSPLGTDRLLAEAIKEAFTLEELLPRDAAEAHRGGIWHIHGLGCPEGYYRLTARLEQVARHGFRALPDRTFGGPPRYGHTLLSQWVAWQDLLDPLSVESVCWPDAAETIDRFMEDREESGYREFALMTAYEFAYRQIMPVGRGDARPPRVMVVGSGREGSRCGAALLERLAEGDDEGLALPGLGVSMDWEPAGDRLADLACRLAAAGGDATFRLGPGLDLRSGAGPAPPLPAERPACLARITLNLPRLAMLGGDRTEALTALDRLALRAAEAGECRRIFLESLLERGRRGPLAIAWDRERCPTRLDPQEAAVELAVDGLWDAALLLAGAGSGAEDVFMAAMAILRRLRESVREAARRSGILIRTAANEDPMVSMRFCEQDERVFPLALAVMAERGGTVNGATYHTGASLPRGVADDDTTWRWTEQVQDLIDVPAPAMLPLDLLEDAGRLRRFLETRAARVTRWLVVRAPWKG
ncbi:MAG: hypothetical protein KBH78_11295 [Candidatus Hydrogenedentes bacterium]|nr:hypothetical protein [Candidatus Hydrogenedentota bacterium]